MGKRFNFSQDVESRSGFLFCASCDDFVYDPALEKMRSRIQMGFQGKPEQHRTSSIY